jgi:pimeloyl-ACP methyl ester carboxylesterase
VAKVRAGDGTEIYYETWGRGEPLLLIPGLGGDLRIWACQRLVFGRGYRCIALDNRGAGHSGKPTGPYSLLDMATDAAAVLDAEGVESAHVVAYSMGTYPAQILAVLAPGRVRSLVLAGTTSRHQPWRRELLADWAGTARERGIHVMARRAFPYLLGPRNARRFRLWINLAWPLILSQPAYAFVAQVGALLEFSDEFRSEVSRITAPTLVLAGAEDRLTPPAEAEEFVALVPGARLEVFGGAGHGLMMEAAPDFNIAVLRFLAEVTAGARMP